MGQTLREWRAPGVDLVRSGRSDPIHGPYDSKAIDSADYERTNVEELAAFQAGETGYGVVPALLVTEGMGNDGFAGTDSFMVGRRGVAIVFDIVGLRISSTGEFLEETLITSVAVNGQYPVTWTRCVDFATSDIWVYGLRVGIDGSALDPEPILGGGGGFGGNLDHRTALVVGDGNLLVGWIDGGLIGPRAEGSLIYPP